MVSINYASREVTCKIVYYGPGLSGKTTNLLYVHKKVPATTKGKMISLATEADRTLYFDFLPINIGKINGFDAKFQLYTVPGQVYYNATRKLVLRGVDGIVFVADSQADKMDENIESLTNMRENMAEYGYNLNDIPVVIQYNKRDLPGALPVEELDAKLNPDKWQSFSAEAVNGPGVFDTLKMIIKLVLDKAKTTRNKSARKAAQPEPQQPEQSVQPAAPPPPQETAAAPPPPPQPQAPPVQPQPEIAAPPPPPPPQPEASPEEVPGLQRQEVYNPAAQAPSQEQVEGFESTARQSAPPDDISTEPTAPPPPDQPQQAEQVGVSADKQAARPYPGSSTARIARRERRITVSDFQPASRDEESTPLQETRTENEDNKEQEQRSDMPTPKMAPPKRVGKQKKGFFKRLFGLK